MQNAHVNDERLLSEESWLGTGIDFRALAVDNQLDTNHKQWPQIPFWIYFSHTHGYGKIFI